MLRLFVRLMALGLWTFEFVERLSLLQRTAPSRLSTLLIQSALSCPRVNVLLCSWSSLSAGFSGTAMQTSGEFEKWRFCNSKIHITITPAHRRWSLDYNVVCWSETASSYVLYCPHTVQWCRDIISVNSKIIKQLTVNKSYWNICCTVIF